MKSLSLRIRRWQGNGHTLSVEVPSPTLLDSDVSKAEKRNKDNENHPETERHKFHYYQTLHVYTNVTACTMCRNTARHKHLLLHEYPGT